MILLISSAKKLDFAKKIPELPGTKPARLKESAVLAGILKRLDLGELADLMALSEDLAALTAGRYQAWRPAHAAPEARPAALAYAGDAYQGLDAWSLGPEDLAWAQDRLRIVSGLYGLLRPLDLIRPYRLEMGARLANPAGADLYAFWREKLTKDLAKALKADGGPLVNLASGESFGAVDPGGLGRRVVTPVFEDPQRGTYRVVSFHAKRARGLMCRYAIRGRIGDAEALKGFDLEGYRFEAGASGPERWVFRR
ncbi:MAG TPA: peroxide stress protein YaaA [Holophaga sp.]|nr:peroxide stress protein YaaA [Holophaga sp.]